MKQNQVVDFAKAFVLRLALGKFLLTLLGAGLSLFLLAFAGALEVKLEGVLFDTRFSVNYGSTTSIVWPLLAGVAIVGLAVWMFFKAQSEPKSKRLSVLEDAYRSKGSLESVRQTFQEIFGVAVRSGPELEYLMHAEDVQSIANSLRRARSHVEFSPGTTQYELRRPNWPYRAFILIFTWLYFALFFLVMLLIPAILAAIANEQTHLAVILAGYLFVISIVAWACLSAYSASFHALRLVKSDA